MAYFKKGFARGLKENISVSRKWSKAMTTARVEKVFLAIVFRIRRWLAVLRIRGRLVPTDDRESVNGRAPGYQDRASCRPEELKVYYCAPWRQDTLGTVRPHSLRGRFGQKSLRVYETSMQLA